MDLPLIFAMLFGGCCAGYEESEEVWREGYDQERLDALAGAYAPVATSTGDTAATGFRPPATGDTGGQTLPADPADFDCQQLCGYADNCELVPPTGDEVVAAECSRWDYCVGGRLHAAIAQARGAGPDEVAAWLAQMAHDEWASAEAFRLLAAELRGHGAPRGLVERVLEAAGDEVRHGRLAGEAARARGGVVPRVALSEVPPRSLEDVARENIVEAVVQETWLALGAWVQARDAEASLRPLFAAIAPDETRHATLAHDLDRWLRSQLDEGANARLDAARDAAVAELMARSDEGPVGLGLPVGDERQRLLAGLRQLVWS